MLVNFQYSKAYPCVVDGLLAAEVRCACISNGPWMETVRRQSIIIDPHRIHIKSEGARGFTSSTFNFD